MRRTPDFSLYLVTDARLTVGRDLLALVAAAVTGGVTVVQLRDKEASSSRLLAQARALRGLLAPWQVPLIVNDRADIALAAGADGVHVGQDDLPCAEVRRLVGPEMLIGVSVGNAREALAAERAGADYLGVSPLFATPTKPDAPPPTGLEGLRQIRAATSLPLVAIGGIQAGHAAEVLRAGANGLAVVSAILAAADPEAAARELAAAIGAARPRRPA